MDLFIYLLTFYLFILHVFKMRNLCDFFLKAYV